MLYRLSDLFTEGELDRRTSMLLWHQERWARRRTARWMRARSTGLTLTAWSGLAAAVSYLVGRTSVGSAPGPHLWLTALALASLLLAAVAYASARVFGGLLAKELDRLEARDRDGASKRARP